MIREMIRKEQQLSDDLCKEILEQNKDGVLAVMGDDEYPYGVPLNYVFYNGKIYFHCAKKGYKIDCIAKNPKVCFTVTDLDEIHSDEITAYFRSVIAMGIASRVDGDEYLAALTAIAEKYMADQPEAARKAAVENCGFGGAYLYGIKIEHLTGKQSEELV